MHHPLATLGALAAAGALLLGPLPSAPAAPAPRGAGASIELVAQTPVAAAGGAFVATVSLDGIPASGSIALDVHQRVRSRSELDQSMQGDGLGRLVFQNVTPISAMPPQPGGTRDVVLSLDPTSGGLPLQVEGVYPLVLTAQDAAGTELATLVTHLIVPPEAGDEAPNLAVSLVAELELPTALQPDGGVDLTRADVDALRGVVEGLAAAPDVPATLAVGAETLEALLASADPNDPELVDAIRAVAADRTVLAEPYVPLDLDGLVAAQLVGEVEHQSERGAEVLADLLGAAPDDGVRLAPPTLGAEGLALLAFTGTNRIVVEDAQVEPLAAGIIPYSLAQPFVVAVPEDAEDEVEDRQPGPVQALAPDPVVMQRLTAEGTAGLAVSRTLAELALLRLEQPSVARSTVLRLTRELEPDRVQPILEAIGSGRPFEAVTLTGAFDHAAPVIDAGGNVADRALRPAPHDEISAGTARSVASTRADVATFGSLVGPDSDLPEAADRQLLVATAAGLGDGERRAHLAGARASMEGVTDLITTPPTFTLTLTARDGTIPLTIRNDTGIPVSVSVRLRSPKLEFPDGDTIELDLLEESTRIDIRVRSRATGAFPLLIDVRTPDERQSLSMSRYTVRSTAVSGVGLALSVGAGLFLTVWWARHWRRTRRSKKLVAADSHPSGVPGPAHSAG